LPALGELDDHPPRKALSEDMEEHPKPVEQPVPNEQPKPKSLVISIDQLKTGLLLILAILVLGAGAWAFHRADWKPIQIFSMVVTFLMAPAFQIINRHFKDPEKKHNSWVFWVAEVVWVITGVLLLIATIGDSSRSQKQSQLQTERVEGQLKELSSKITDADVIRKEYKALVQQIVTNPAYQVDFRLAVLQAASTNRDVSLSPKLDSIKSYQEDLMKKIKERRLFNQLNQEKQLKSEEGQRITNYFKLNACADYAIKQALLISEMSVGNSDKVIHDYTGIPLSMAVQSTNGAFAAIKLKTNSVWNLTVTMDTLNPGFLRVDIKGTGSMLAMVSDGRAELDIPDLGNEIFNLDVTNYTSTIDGKVKLLIANEFLQAFKH
jgi:hypothetical protein